MTRLVSGSNLELSKNSVMRMTCPCYRQWHLLCRSCVSIERRAIKVLTARKIRLTGHRACEDCSGTVRQLQVQWAFYRDAARDPAYTGLLERLTAPNPD